MFSIKKLLGHDEKFFDLLEASAEQADQSVHHLVALLAELEHKDSPAEPGGIRLQPAQGQTNHAGTDRTALQDLHHSA